MASFLGKRKRRDEVFACDKPEDNPAEVSAKFKALLQQHFESKFEPLPQIQATHIDTGGSDEEPESNWSGLSDDHISEDTAVIYAPPEAAEPDTDIPREELKQFMVFHISL